MPDSLEIVETMRQQSAEREARQAAAAAEKRAENRRRMPQVTAWVDEAREVFGDVTVAFASEGGVTMGRRSPEGIPLVAIGSYARPKKVAKKR